MSDKPDIAADIIRSVFERVVIDTPEGPMVLREVPYHEDRELVLWIEPDEPVVGTLHFGEASDADDQERNRDAACPKGGKHQWIGDDFSGDSWCEKCGEVLLD